MTKSYSIRPPIQRQAEIWIRHSRQSLSEHLQLDIWLYSIPLTSHTMIFVVQRTFRWPPFHSPELALILLISRKRACRRDKSGEVPETDDSVEGGWPSEGMIMRKESSVSIWADREFKLVDPKRVKTGGVDGLGESQIPKEIKSELVVVLM